MTDEARTPLQLALAHVLSDVDCALADAGKAMLDEGAPAPVVLTAIIAVRARYLPSPVARAERLAGRIERTAAFITMRQDGRPLH